ncbi:hypothetical protein BDM02DRAFT_3132038 [Thelephora ganbajun]|uniref:Uncharacterized protein n=1 Tax=Thelephora ganbajun TaxID=370292 RepID=A0ACB6Z3M2_THEGA|nr:hypothetical protein BDM02DRAFT_3132038 [Thelephora ganbajun]
MLIVPAIQHLACLLLLSWFHAHTTSTLSLLREHINKFGQLSKTLGRYCTCKVTRTGAEQTSRHLLQIRCSRWLLNEVIMSICYRVDTYNEQHLFNNTSSDLNTNTSAICLHIQLGSLDKIMHLYSYTKKLSIDIKLQDFLTLLTKFLHLNHVLDTENNDISNFKEMAVKKMDLLHITTSWHGSGARYDCAILQGSRPSELIFCQHMNGTIWWP